MGAKMWAMILTAALAAAGCDDRGDDPDAGDEDAEVEDQPPEFEGEPTEEVPLYATYRLEVSCEDPEEEDVELDIGSDDSCGGELIDVDDGEAVYTFEPPEEEGAECAAVIECSDGEQTAEWSFTVTVEEPDDIEDLEFAEAELWAQPIRDYIDAALNEMGPRPFMRGIHDLAVYQGRLYLGYGDATANLGRVFPIEPRYWTGDDPEDVRSDFATDEEQIDQYRVFGDLLIIPGVDATEDDLLGNVYTLWPGEEWSKSRTLELAWHVHDAAVIDDVIYACGSGGSIDDYNNSTVNALLFVSDDDGEAFEHAAIYPHPQPPGDNRFTNLLAVDGELFVMGYFSSIETGVTYPQAFQLVDGELVGWGELGDFFTLKTHSLSEDRGLVVGVEIATDLTFGLRLVTADGVEIPDALADAAVLDVQPLGDGRAVVLAVEGNEYPLPEADEREVMAVLIDDEGEQVAELFRQTVEDMPLAVAFWRRELYLGLDDGTVWRAEAPFGD